ncbi:VCBS domain-containing protein, partial [Arcobacter arenosus]
MLSIEKYEQNINLDNLMSSNEIKELILRDFQKGKTITIELSSNISYMSELTNDGKDLTLTFNDNAQTFKIVLKGMVEILNSNDGTDLIKLIETDTEKTYSISDLASAMEASAAGGEVLTQGDGTQNPAQNNELTFENTPALAGRLDTNNEFTQNGFFPLIENLNQNNNETNVFYSGKLIDGYISGSTVFIDANNNGILDAGEKSTTTDANGDFSFSGLTQTELEAGPIVAFGGTDISTGLPFEGFYTAPNGSTTVSPLSTLMHELVKDGLTENEAESLIANTFGLVTNIDLLNYDPIQEQNPQVQAIAVQIANLVNLSAALLSNVEGQDELDASLIAFDSFAQILQDNPNFDLSNPADIEKFLREITNNNPSLDFEDISSNIANINLQVEQAVDAQDPFATMAEIQRIQAEDLENKFTSNDAPNTTEEVNIIEENDLNDVTIGGTEIVDYNYTGSVAGNATDINGDDIEYSYAGNLNISLSTTNTVIVSALNNPSPEFTQVLKTYFFEFVSNPLVSAVIDDSQKLQEIEAFLLEPTTSITDAITYLNNLTQVNIDLTTGEFTIEGIVSEKYVNLLQTNNALIIDMQSDGTYTLNSPYFNLLTPNEKLEISFDYQSSDGMLVDVSTVSLIVNGGNEAPVITVEEPIMSALSESDFADNSSGIPNYYKIISLEEVYNLLGVEDVDDVSLTVSLDDGKSTFTINGTDVTGDTNGVFQLRDGVYNSNWANQGANENDLVIYSEEIDSLDENQTMNITFDVKAYDGTDFSEAKTVSVAVSGENDIPVITVEEPIMSALSESDFADNSSGIPNYYKIISLEEVYNLLGVEDVDDVSLTVSLDDGKSTFTINGTDVTGDTNGVFQLR